MAITSTYFRKRKKIGPFESTLIKIETNKKHGEKKIKPIIENKISKIRLTINIFF